RTLLKSPGRFLEKKTGCGRGVILTSFSGLIQGHLAQEIPDQVGDDVVAPSRASDGPGVAPPNCDRRALRQLSHSIKFSSR
ncbi:MAG: hypothetical protein AAFN80_18095, partial [Pseudomonadota bacterium]